MRETAEGRKLMMRAAMAAVLVALLLLVLKGIAYGRSDSIAILGSATDSAMDFFASIISFMALRAAFKRDDRKSCPSIRIAQAKANYAVAGVFLVAAGYLAYRAFWQVFEPIPLEHGFLAVAVSVFAILASLSILTLQKNVIDKTDSGTIAANRMQFLADILLNITAIIALLLATGADIYEADGIFGMGIAGYVAFSAYMIIIHTKELVKKNETEAAAKEDE